jgi:hypothetical protein
VKLVLMRKRNLCCLQTSLLFQQVYVEFGLQRDLQTVVRTGYHPNTRVNLNVGNVAFGVLFLFEKYMSANAANTAGFPLIHPVCLDWTSLRTFASEGLQLSKARGVGFDSELSQKSLNLQ